MKTRKGYALVPSTTILMLIVAGVLGIIFILGIANYYDVRTVVLEVQTERHAIDLAQVILSSEKLVYYDNDHYHRAVFDKQKLEDVMEAEFIFQNTELDIAYPNSMTMIAVTDLETDEVWSTTVYGPITLKGLMVTDFVNCLTNKANFVKDFTWKGFADQLFRSPSGLSPWDNFDLGKCNAELNAKTEEKMSNFFASGSPVTTRGFPVAIKDGDEIHIGRMMVGVLEF